MDVFIKGTTTPFADIFTYRKTRLETKDSSFRNGPRLIEDFSTLKRLNDLKPGRITPEGLEIAAASTAEDNPSQTLLIYMWTLTENLSTREIDLDFIRSMLEGGASLKSADKYGQTILHAFVRDWNPDIIRFAEEQCVDLDVQDKFGVSPLHLAAGMDLKESTEELLKHGANVNIRTFNNLQTPLHYAAKYNSVEALKVLVSHGGDIQAQDVMKRTPLFIAAEYGRSGTVQYLLDIGAPVGVVNDMGVSAMSFIAEKMPEVAYNALSQYVLEDSAKKQVKWFINTLENYDNNGMMVDKTPLELIAIYDQFEMASHPVVQKAIEVKWNMYGRRDTWMKLILTCFQLILWMILAYTFPDNHNYYTPLTKNGWKIGLEAVIIMSWFYLFAEEMKKRGMIAAGHKRWIACKKRALSKNLSYCHPTWSTERKYLTEEMKRVKRAPSLAKAGRVWYYYELVYLFILIAVIGTRIADILLQDTPEDRAKLPAGEKMTSLMKNVFLSHKMMFCLGMITAFGRVFKFLVRFRTMGIFLRLSALSVGSFIQFLLLFAQFYIPLTAAYWALFGGNDASHENVHLMAETAAKTGMVQTKKVTHGNTTHLTLAREVDIFYLSSLSEIAFNVWEIIVNNGALLFLFVEFEPVIVRILFALSSFLITFVGFQIFNALVVFTFRTKFSVSTSRAFISIATTMINYEKGCPKAEYERIKREHKKHFNPLVEPLYSGATIGGEEQSLLEDIAKSHRKVKKMLEKFRDAEKRYQDQVHRKDEEILLKLKERIKSFVDQQQSFKQKMKKELTEIAKQQESFVKSLPKMLEKNAKAAAGID